MPSSTETKSPTGHSLERLPDEILKVEELVRPKLCLFWGKSGTGKTPAASSWPAPLRWIDADYGKDSIFWAMKAGVCPHKIEDFKFAHPHNIVNEKGALKQATGWWQTLDKINEWLSEEHINEWQTLVVDTTTTVFSDFAMTSSLEVTGQKWGDQKKPMSDTIKIARETGMLVPDIGDYRPAKSYVQQLVQELKRIAYESRKWIILIAHEYEATEASGIGEQPRIVGYEPNFIGSHRKELIKDMGEVYCFLKGGTKETPRFEVLTNGDAMRVARSRFGCLDTKIDWTNKALYPIVREAVEKFYGHKL